MSLEANAGTTQHPVEPLKFRSIEELDAATAASHPVAAFVPDPTPPFDIAAALRGAREQGRMDAMAMAESDAQAQLQQERDAMSRTLQQFMQEKQLYFSEVESEVVKLSLAIAERVLHREAAMDPLLLAGAARVALDQIADSSEAVLLVAATDIGRWHDTLTPARGMVIEVDEAMGYGEAVLKTRSGTVQLGMRAQLQEIERGFFELLGRKPSLAA